MTLTVNTLLAATRTVHTLQGPPAPASSSHPTVLKDLSERLFPESHNRSKRIHEKPGKRSAARCRVVSAEPSMHTQPWPPAAQLKAATVRANWFPVVA
jgi:hypothetical protein